MPAQQVSPLRRSQVIKDLIFLFLAGMRDVSRREYDIGSTATLPVIGDGLDQRSEDDTAIVWIAAPDVEIRPLSHVTAIGT
jgi:hypothetical protein